MSSVKASAAQTGRLGEEEVARFLKENGCIIVKRNWKTRYGELDIVADDGENLIFVEVKTRSKGAMVSGIDAVDAGKKLRTRNAAEVFALKLHTNLNIRIDVADVVIYEDKNGKYKADINYYKNAF